MNRSDLVRDLADRRRLRMHDAGIVVDTVLDGIARTLVDGGRVEIRGFGTFSVREYAAYRGRNPRTGAAVEVSPKRLPYFKVGKELQQKCR